MSDRVESLAEADRGKVWRPVGRDWPFYRFADGQWRCYPVDPRRSPRVMHVATAGAALRDGYEEVP
jgi:hypothetical protein